MSEKNTTEWHIAFHPAVSGSIRAMLEENDQSPENVFFLWDDLSVGPLHAEYNEEFLTMRQNWWLDVLSPEFSEGDWNDAIKIISIDEKLNAGNTITLWCGPSAYEHLGLEKIAYIFQKYATQIAVIQVEENESLLIHKPIKGLGECSPDMLKKLLSLKRSLQPDEVSELAHKWKNAASSKSMIRIRKNNAYEHHDVSYLDKKILGECSSELQNGAQIAGQLLAYSSESQNLDFIIWRIRELTKNGGLECNGNPFHLSEISLKRL